MPTPEDRANELRQNLSETERLVWRRLRGRRFGKFKFRRQVALGRYIVDFVCFNRRLIVELDGGQHTLNREYDAKRTAWLEREGFRVVRFWNHDVLGDWDAVADAIWRALHVDPAPMAKYPSPPAPLPQGARGGEPRAKQRSPKKMRRSD